MVDELNLKMWRFENLEMEEHEKEMMERWKYSLWRSLLRFGGVGGGV
jgi:hypothetical protein